MGKAAFVNVKIPFASAKVVLISLRTSESAKMALSAAVMMEMLAMPLCSMRVPALVTSYTAA